MKFRGKSALLFTFLLATVSVARADIIVSVGYYDLAPCCGNSNALPSPWYGSPNTSFLGSVSEATSSDPDASAILFSNTGSTAVTLDQGVTVGSLKLWDSLIGVGGFSILPGTSVILSGTSSNALDGSDIGLGGATISFSLNGTLYSAVDTDHILGGFAAYDETEPWTEVGDFLKATSTVPEPASLTLFAFGLLGVMLRVRRTKP
jgi:hypothetical protein